MEFLLHLHNHCKRFLDDVDEIYFKENVFFDPNGVFVRGWQNACKKLNHHIIQNDSS